MFDVGFSEVLLIFVIALVVLGPEKLPRLASQVGRWVGRARAMARQFREQLEEEVNLEEVRKAQQARKPDEASESHAASASTAGPSAAPSSTTTTQLPPNAATIMADSANLHSDTYSHAHPTNEHGANPYTPDGGAGTPGPTEPRSFAAEPSRPTDPDPRSLTEHSPVAGSTASGSAAHPAYSDGGSGAAQASPPAAPSATPGAGATPSPQPEDAAAGPHGHA